MATIKLISPNNRNRVPGPGLDNNIYVKSGDVNPLITQVNTNTTNIATILGGFLYQGVLALPANYPAATQDQYWIVSVAGQIGGTGPVLEIGDQVICTTTSVGGTHAAVGTSYTTIQKNMVPLTEANFQAVGSNVSDFMTRDTLADAFNGGTTCSTAANTLVLSAGTTSQLDITSTAGAKAVNIASTAQTVDSITATVTVNSTNYNFLSCGIAPSAALSAGEVITGTNFSHTDAAADAVTSQFLGHQVSFINTSGSQSDLIGVNIVHGSGGDTYDAAGAANYVGYNFAPTGTFNAAAANLYGLKIDASGATITSLGTSYGLYLDATATTNDLGIGMYGVNTNEGKFTFLSTGGAFVADLTAYAEAQALMLTAQAHTDTDAVVDMTLTIKDAAAIGYQANVSMSNVFTGATVAKLYDAQVGGAAGNADGSGIICYNAKVSGISTDRADYSGFVADIASYRDNADTDAGVTVGFTGTIDHSGATWYGVRVSGSTATYTDGKVYGLYFNHATAASSDIYGVTSLTDSTSADNNKFGILVSKDLTNATAAGALAQTNPALSIEQSSASSASASDVMTVSNTTAQINTINSNSTVNADIYAGTVLDVGYSATTTVAGVATSSSTGLLVDYDLTNTAGTLNAASFNVAYIDVDFDNTTAIEFANGTYNGLNINLTDNATANYAATATMSGASIDVSGMTVTDADLTLYGLNVVGSAAGTSTVAAGRFTDGTTTTLLSDGTNAITATGAVVDGQTIGDGLSPAFFNVKSLKYIVGINGVAGCDYNFDADADMAETGIQLGAGAIIPAASRVLDVVLRCVTSEGTAATITWDIGVSDGSNEYLAAATNDADGDINGVTVGGYPYATISDTASSVYVSATPDANWSTLTNGKWEVYVTYIDNSATA